MRAVYWAKKLKKFNLILEVEEFYNDVFLKSKMSRTMERKFIACADKYIFPTGLFQAAKLSEKLTVKDHWMAVISRKDGREQYCHGFLCIAEKGDFCVFLDAQTGKEAEILLVENNGNGQFSGKNY